MNFGANETSKSFSVDIKDDTNREGLEQLRLILSNPTGGATLSSPFIVDLMIVDDEVLTFSEGSLRLSESNYRVLESDGEVTIIVERVGGALGAVSVDYGTIENTAKKGQDYVHVSGTLIFGAGETKKAFAVPILDDPHHDPNEFFTIILSNPTNGAKMIEPDRADIMIL